MLTYIGGYTMNGIYVLESIVIVSALLSVSVALSYAKVALKRYSQLLSGAKR